jgi:transcriptional regulator with XRE-family HTH domain
MDTLEYLDACKERLGVESDYALAQRLGVKQPTITSYRKGRSRMSDDVALKVSEILQLHPLQVIAAANAERAETDAQREKWIALMEKFSVSFRNLLSPWDGRDRRAQARLFVQ